jgi:hypothetical protein
MATNNMDAIDKVVMYGSGALLLLGIAVLGLVETLAGEPFAPAPITNDAGEVIAQPMIDPSIRTGLVVLAIVILALWSIYKVLAPALGIVEGPQTGETPAR